jgi:hypothetical protein
MIRILKAVPQRGTDHAVMMYTAAMTGIWLTAGEWKAAFALLGGCDKRGVEPNEATLPP